MRCLGNYRSARGRLLHGRSWPVGSIPNWDALGEDARGTGWRGGIQYAPRNLAYPRVCADQYIVALSGLPDADDTARTILALQGLGRKVNPNAMIVVFEGGYYFLTYKGERNPSFSTNCNVAACLLAQEDPSKYSAQIQKCIQFLSTHTFERGIRDKWVRIHCQP
jgi:hypothetical protein